MRTRAVLVSSLLAALLFAFSTRMPHPEAASTQPAASAPASAASQQTPPVPRYMLDPRPAPQVMAELTAAEPADWLEAVNEYRGVALLPPVTQDLALTGCVEHSTYCVKNNVLVHAENPALPFYTPQGDVAGQSSNVMASGSFSATDQSAVDLWMQGPFHAVGIIDPVLERSNFGSYREMKDSGFRMAATLDVIRGRNAAKAVTFPVIFPADGQALPARCAGGTTACYPGGESPNPLTSCAGYTTPTGHPLILQLGKGGVTPNVTAHSFMQGATPLEHCVYDETSYTNPDAGSQSLGRDVLGSRDAIVLVPRAPLNAGHTYTASITTNGTTHTWTFGVGAPPLPPGPTMTLDKTSLQFGAVTDGVSFLAQTSSQIVRLTQSGLPGVVSWTATPNQPWLTVSPSSGVGPADLSIGVVATGGLPVGGSVNGAITLSFTGAGNTAGPINVALTTYPLNASVGPFGVVDTPSDNQTGVSGAVPFTGWVLDDVEVDEVAVCRASVAGEPSPNDPRCGALAPVFIGTAVFVDGARPDVQAAFPTFPRNTRAGYGFMVLTNMLPDVGKGTPTGGNGTYLFALYARDREGHVVLLGQKTMTCDNENATRPFGTIDTPGQGEVVSGSAYVNFGWALTPQPKFIPFDGSTITVFLDGLPIGNVSYNHFRADIAGFFPGLANSDGAVGFRVLDTTALANGVHTIAWGVTDNLGAVEGLGSRFFTVSNSGGAATAAAQTLGAVTLASPPLIPDGSAGVEKLPIDRSSIRGRRGFNPDAPLRDYAVGASGRVLVRGEEVDRVELHLSTGQVGTYSGYLRAGRELAALPIGSHLDPETGLFTWQPAVGFVGTYDLVFVRSSGGRGVARQEVRVILQPKGSGRQGPQVVIDTPRAQQDVAQPFMLAGWAADLNADIGTGIETMHVWAYPLAGGSPIFLGVADAGGIRPDVAEIHGEQFRASGWGLTVQGLVPGNYDLAVFAWSTRTAGFVPASVVRVTVR